MTNKQKQEFGNEISEFFHDELSKIEVAESVIEWICKNITPDEVFSRDTLKHWCKENEGYLENKYPVQEY